MKENSIAIRLMVAATLIAVLATIALQFFADANAAPPTPSAQPPPGSAQPPPGSAQPPPGTPARELRRISDEDKPLADSQVSPAAMVATGVVTLYAAADAQVLQGAAGTNYGIGSEMLAGQSGCEGDVPGVERSLVKFDLSEVPPGTIVNSAKLRLHLVSSCAYPGDFLTITPYQIKGDWQEETVTWNSQPALGSSYPPHSIQAGAWGWYSFDVTNLARGWVNGTSPNYGLMLRGPESSASWLGFGTKGFGRYKYGAQLLVDLVVPPQTLKAGSASLSFMNEVGGAISQTQELTIQNLGADALTWNASETIPWLSLGRTSGTAKFTLPDTVHVRVDRSGLSAGQYTGQIQITSSTPGVQGSPQVVNVTLNLRSQLPRVYLPVVLKGNGGSPSTQENIIALFVGISDYEHMEPVVGVSGRAGAPGPDMESGDIDAMRARGIMLSKSSRLRAQETLLNARATKGAIRKKIVNWAADMKALYPNSTFLLFISSHGMYAADNNGDEADGYDEFIVPYDVDCINCDDEHTRVWLPETAIRDDELGAWLDELRAPRTVVILDSCFSGGMATGTAASARGLVSRADLSASAVSLQASDGFAQDVNGSGRVILMASAANQGSWEFGGLEHGAFTYYLLQALSTSSADTDRNGWVSAEEAFTYSRGRVDSYVYTTTHVHQNPQISDGISGQLDLTQP